MFRKVSTIQIKSQPNQMCVGVTSGTLLGNIVSQEGIAIDPDKVKVVIEAPPPTNDKALSWFLGQIRWHNRMIRYRVDVVTPLHTAVHKKPFQ